MRKECSDPHPFGYCGGIAVCVMPRLDGLAKSRLCGLIAATDRDRHGSAIITAGSFVRDDKSPLPGRRVEDRTTRIYAVLLYDPGFNRQIRRC